MLAIIGIWAALLGQAISSTGDASKADSPPDPVAQAYAQVQADLVVLAKAQADVRALADATSRAKAAADALAADKQTLATAIDQAANPVPVVPPVKHAVEVLCLSSDTCLPCKEFEPVLLAMQSEGIPVKISKDVTDAVRYAIKTTPTYIMLVDGTEVSRAGILKEDQLRGWYADTVTWAAKLKTVKEPSE